MKFIIVSDYAGEQGHPPGGDRRIHDKPFKTFGEANKKLQEMIDNHEMDYRDYRIEVVKS